MWRIISTRRKPCKETPLSFKLTHSQTPIPRGDLVSNIRSVTVDQLIMSDTAEIDMHPWTHSCQPVNVNLFLVTLFAYISMGLPDICQFWCTLIRPKRAPKSVNL